MNLSTQLDQLETANLIRRAEEELAYLFRHHLTQEAAYESLLIKRRREIHRRVAESYETLYAPRLDEFAALLAQHYAAAGDDEKTAAYSIQAAKAAMRTYAFPEARVQVERALEAFKRLPDTDENRRRHIDAIFDYVEVTWGAFVPQELFGLVTKAEALARTLRNPDGTLGDPLRLAQIHNRLTALHLARNDHREAIRYARQALDEASVLGDKTLVSTSSAQFGMALGCQGHFEGAQPYLVRTITLLEETPDRWEWFDSVGWLGITLAMQGQVAAGAAEAQRALTRVVATNNHFGITHCRANLLPIYWEQADMAQLLEESERTIETAIKSESALYASYGWGFNALARSALGQHQAAQSSMATAREVGAQVGSQSLLSDWMAAADAELAYREGAWEQAIAQAERAIAMAQSSDGIFAVGWAQRVWALALAQLEPRRRDQAAEHLATSLRLFEEGKALLEAARTRVAWGKLLSEGGRVDSARRHFEKAAAQFEVSGLTRELEETRALLSAANSSPN